MSHKNSASECLLNPSHSIFRIPSSVQTLVRTLNPCGNPSTETNSLGYLDSVVASTEFSIKFYRGIAPLGCQSAVRPWQILFRTSIARIYNENEARIEGSHAEKLREYGPTMRGEGAVIKVIRGSIK